MRWLHRLRQILSAIGRVIATLVQAALQTFRQRRAKKHAAATPVAPERAMEAHPDAGQQRDQASPATDSGEIVVSGTTIEMPKPSIWPAVVGLGTAVALMGVATSLGISLAGVILLAIGLGGWIGELHHE